MSTPVSPRILMIQQCQEAIIRIRSARTAGDFSSEAVSNDFAFILCSVTPTFLNEARKLRPISPLLDEEAFEMMVEQLVADICSPSYPSLTTRFGARLRSIPIQVRRTLARKNSPNRSLHEVVSFDAARHEQQSLHETLSDPYAEQALARVDDHLMLASLLLQIPAEERQVWLLRQNGMKNVDIARELGVSEATISRIAKRADQRLAQLYTAMEE